MSTPVREWRADLADPRDTYRSVSPNPLYPAPMWVQHAGATVCVSPGDSASIWEWEIPALGINGYGRDAATALRRGRRAARVVSAVPFLSGVLRYSPVMRLAAVGEVISAMRRNVNGRVALISAHN